MKYVIPLDLLLCWPKPCYSEFNQLFLSSLPHQLSHCLLIHCLLSNSYYNINELNWIQNFWIVHNHQPLFFNLSWILAWWTNWTTANIFIKNKLHLHHPYHCQDDFMSSSKDSLKPFVLKIMLIKIFNILDSKTSHWYW